jgi:DNA topoisomerase-1
MILIIAEKPDAAMRIAQALADKKPEKKISKYEVNYYEFKRKGKKHIVIAAVGHLFNLKQSDKGWDYPIFNVEWIPSFKARKQSEFSEKYFRTIEWIADKNKKSKLISACDYDNEGSLIAANIIKFIFNKNDAKRMKFSTLTKPDLIESYKKMMPHLDTKNVETGIARHFLDYYYGVNVTRALTLAIKKMSPRFAILSSGRVQGPLLTILAEKELEIKKFKPKPYWQLQLALLIGKQKIIALYEKEKIWDKKTADKIFKSSKGKPAIVESVVKKKYKQNPPVPFNITSLQTEAYRLFGYSPQQTLRIAQDLYTKAFISYPRTSSEKLPPQINYKAILKALSKNKQYKKICGKILSGELKPVEGKRTDPAHEAIRPTVEPPKRTLTGPRQKIYNLVCRRFFSVFGEPAKRESMKVIILVNKNKFSFTGRRTIEKGWTEFYGPYAKADEVTLPDMKKGDKLKIKKLEQLAKETSHPPRYSQASIIKLLEQKNLGTRATRAGILQTLYTRDYVKGKSIQVTELGLKLAKMLKKYVPDLVDEKLTRKFEKELQKIFEGKIKKEKVLLHAKKTVTKICQEFKQNENKIGKQLGKAVVVTQEDKSLIGPCPNCGNNLKRLYSPRTRKFWVGCTGYPKCKTGYPLPHGSMIQRLEKICDKCNTPMITVIRKGKRPFRMCLDPKCETKKDWGKPKKKAPKKTKKRKS